ncbi:hypothetical protein N7537_010297 [Penicillium hordei]|uniref:Major facilitator superfamily (MFS) profile domain-containing protein n=1 Tax=Penicillium hordei TaxID=40994 RepID=A0AAD6DUN4_9EURO|nr:uncharacterized protein N7537_010297 [Penicillium hordei]KAJ5593393.1 hypothetical protein N7537_010297 [Penicillium hordei]
MGWRYIDIVLGGICLIMFIVHCLILGIHESPKWLVSKGRIDDAVKALNSISSKNKSECTADLQQSINIPQEQAANPTWLEDVISIRELFCGQKNIKLTNGAHDVTLGVCWNLGNLACRLSIPRIICWLILSNSYPLYDVFLPYYLEVHAANLGDSINY